MGFQRPDAGFRFIFQGMKTNTAADEMPPTKYPYAKNVRYVKSLQTRPGYQLLFATSLDIITACPLPSGEVGVVYSEVLTAVGGSLPYVWTIFSGALPAGLSLATNGTISGTPSLAGSSSFVIRLTDNNGTITSKSCSMTVLAAVAISTTCPLPDGEETTAYSQQLAASGGSSPFVWSITAGALPAGLTMTSGGLISGTPTAVEVATFTIHVVDSLGATANKSCQITVASPFSAMVFTDHFTAGPTAHGSQDLGVMWGVINRAALDINQTGLNITHDADGDCLHFDYMTGNGQCNGAAADMSYAVPGDHSLLQDSDQLSEGICVADNSVVGSLTRTGPACFIGGSWNGNTVSGYYISFAPESGTAVLTRINNASDTVIGTAKTAAIGNTLTITVKDTGASTRVRLFVNGVQVDEVFDSAAGKITSGSPGWMGRFCSAPRYSKWTPMVCAEPI